MPEFPRKTSQTSRHAPKEERQYKPECAPAIVSQKPSKDPGKDVEVVEDGAGHYLVGESCTSVGILTDVVLSVVIIVEGEDI